MHTARLTGSALEVLPLPLWTLTGGQVIAITGPMASGKTALLDAAAAAITSSRNYSIAVRFHGRRPGTWLAQASQIIRDRAAERTCPVLAPSRHAPLLVVLADNCHLLDGEDAVNLDRIAQTCRPEAVALVAAGERLPEAVRSSAGALITLGSAS